MATGTGNLPYPGKVYTPFDILTAEELNEDVANIESLATGAGIGDGAVTTGKIGAGAVTNEKAGFVWTAYTPVVTGFSAPPAGAIYRYIKIGTMATIVISQPTNGTSNSTSFTVSLPFKAGAIGTWNAPVIQPVNGGSVETGTVGIGQIDAGSTVLTLFRNLTGSTWTASGGKRVPVFQLTYETE